MKEQLESAIKGLDEMRISFKTKKENLVIEIYELQKRLGSLEEEEEKELQEAQHRITNLSNRMEEEAVGRPSSTDTRKQLEASLECPICLEICWPPKHILQCVEGHLICGECAISPELKVCPQCRVNLAGGQGLSRCRALEELACKAFPNAEQQ